LRLSLRANILGEVNISKKYAIITEGKDLLYSSDLEVTTKLKKFAITEAYFQKRAVENPEKIPLKHSLTKGKKDSLGYFPFNINFSLDAKFENSESGTLFFVTNHPKKPLIEIRCMLEKAKKSK
jgi:hypothetical protein